jgi:hypothetical protein
MEHQSATAVAAAAACSGIHQHNNIAAAMFHSSSKQ